MFKYGIDALTVNKVIEISKGTLKAVVTSDAAIKIKECRRKVEVMANSDVATYGINTGFGPLCDVQISPEETSKLQENLLITHAVGVGNPIDKKLSKMMMICKVHALCQGFSGVRLELIERIIYFIENDLLPVVPEQGSVGASGDLAPLSHLFLPLLGEGEFWQSEEIISAKEVLKKHNLQPLTLMAKEGLGLINGTQFILSHAILGLKKMEYVLDLADVTGAMTLEGYSGNVSPFKEELHLIRPFKGNLKVAERMRMLLKDSENVADTTFERVQDPYSIRCMPQVHGASRNAYAHLKELAEIEMNSVTDNPIVLSETEAISGGNFHGQPLAMALDYTSIAVSELGNIADRRCYLLLEGKHGLPRLLTSAGGLNSGFMIPQYTTAALVTENKSLCFPPSADSVPTSLGQEDHVSMGSISGRKFNQILGNLDKILAIELMYAAQAMDFRRPNTFSPILEENFKIIRNKVAKLEEDRILKDDINALIKMVKNQEFKVC
ncbi:histidine ammonia-lyase [Tenacibaculum finnmarkense genomovar finnmarkense]|uniref:histidine ammonia-lyase n=1 Tax=Tenacibaculum finnmarkense TaxID=2781243 RepID=UPI001EFAD372|nr:histidine ammonia-lyase [Tenacibaculum finnmarkense]MCG8209081.1 histidine ammonia-lyase [Tenacibaculum finnmarkense genomovar finnmarkense]MCG8211603.1 histidine ammonia-lyase [Tenacibaculum finnmarkense genomovar finnmarkense]MCG8218927.1 histidine ammonia-lyase [Tenacibaculum finnmarkense genomovar finnmarkense]MCG8221343.1 histidine ammonia-lyase [Tenacibaculum finnmarkense genomovar finnmarkense]MCG8224652.1 histidine ammonia-lyase [Tenacibaculum finnmarkense genomovar finnmarkense]